MQQSRDVTLWLQSFKFSTPLKNIRQDLANGFAVAEILSHYIPSVNLRTYDTGQALERKMNNWGQLEKFFATNHIPVTKQQVDSTIQRVDGAGLSLLETLYVYFNKSSPSPLPPHPKTPSSLYYRDVTAAYAIRSFHPPLSMTDLKEVRASREQLLEAHKELAASRKTTAPERTLIVPARSLVAISSPKERSIRRVRGQLEVDVTAASVDVVARRADEVAAVANGGIHAPRRLVAARSLTDADAALGAALLEAGLDPELIAAADVPPDVVTAGSLGCSAATGSSSSDRTPVSASGGNDRVEVAAARSFFAVLSGTHPSAPYVTTAVRARCLRAAVSAVEKSAGALAVGAGPRANQLASLTFALTPALAGPLAMTSEDWTGVCAIVGALGERARAAAAVTEIVKVSTTGGNPAGPPSTVTGDGGRATWAGTSPWMIFLQYFGPFFDTAFANATTRVPAVTAALGWAPEDAPTVAVLQYFLSPHSRRGSGSARRGARGGLLSAASGNNTRRSSTTLDLLPSGAHLAALAVALHVGWPTAAAFPSTVVSYALTLARAGASSTAPADRSGAASVLAALVARGEAATVVQALSAVPVAATTSDISASAACADFCSAVLLRARDAGIVNITAEGSSTEADTLTAAAPDPPLDGTANSGRDRSTQNASEEVAALRDLTRDVFARILPAIANSVAPDSAALALAVVAPFVSFAATDAIDGGTAATSAVGQLGSLPGLAEDAAVRALLSMPPSERLVTLSGPAFDGKSGGLPVESPVFSDSAGLSVSAGGLGSRSLATKRSYLPFPSAAAITAVCGPPGAGRRNVSIQVDPLLILPSVLRIAAPAVDRLRALSGQAVIRSSDAAVVRDVLEVLAACVICSGLGPKTTSRAIPVRGFATHDTASLSPARRAAWRAVLIGRAPADRSECDLGGLLLAVESLPISADAELCEAVDAVDLARLLIGKVYEEMEAVRSFCVGILCTEPLSKRIKSSSRYSSVPLFISPQRPKTASKSLADLVNDAIGWLRILREEVR